MKNIIYGLADNRNDLIYYVGKTSVGIGRPLSHLANSHSKEVNEWINSVREDWGDIKIFILEEVEDLNDLPVREKYWIDEKIKQNENLLNKIDLPKIINSYKQEDEDKFNELKRSILFYNDIVKNKRLSLNITQEELAKESNISRSTLSLLESGNNITIDGLKKVLLTLTGLDIKNKSIEKTIKTRARKQSKTYNYL